MFKSGRDALICDMAETYHIYDIKQYSVTLIATLAAGLKEDSRIRMKMEGRKLSTSNALLALTFDKINMFCYGWTEDAKYKKNKPVSVYEMLTGGGAKKAEKAVGFDTPEDFEKKRKELIGGKHG